MKRILLLAIIGIIGGIAILKNISKKDSLHFVESADDADVSQEDKNFGAFPPEIPAHQFDALFI
ncbi:MAG TPA: hypothetical protein VGA55_09355 [Bacteroidota bacterium]